MTGGGSLAWEPGEWTDDTQTTLAILGPLAKGAAQGQLVDEVEQQLLRWMESRPRDVGGQTLAVLSEALRSGKSLTEVTSTWQSLHPAAAGNGSLMRTGPLGLLDLPRHDLANLAGSVSALTHASDDAAEACILWSDAINRSISTPTTTPQGRGWIDLVADGITLLPPAHGELWRVRHPAVQFVGRGNGHSAGLPTVGLGVHHEKAVAVPERQQFAAGLAIQSRPGLFTGGVQVGKVEMLRGLLFGVDIAHHLGAQHFGGLVERDGVAL